MPVATKLRPSAKPATEPRAILKPGGNRVVKVSEEPKRKKENPKNSQQGPRKQVPEISDSVIRSNVSLDSTCSSDSSSGNSPAKEVNSANASSGRRTVKRGNVFKAVRVVPDAGDGGTLSPPPKASAPPKRCDWITPNSGKCAGHFTTTLKKLSKCKPLTI